MLTIGDMAVGDKLCLGSYRPISALCIRLDLSEDIIWVKVSSDNFFVPIYSYINLPMDAAEPRNRNSQRAEHGDNFFPHSNLFQWLNAQCVDWFHPMHIGDVCHPHFQSDRVPGFLSVFSPEQLSIVVPHNINVRVPSGHRRDFGHVYSTSCLVSALSLSQVSVKENRDERLEGALFSAASSGRFNMPGWLRTTPASSLSSLYMRGTYKPYIPCDVPKMVLPLIRLKEETPIILSSGEKNAPYMLLESSSPSVDVDELFHLFHLFDHL